MSLFLRFTALSLHWPDAPPRRPSYGCGYARDDAMAGRRRRPRSGRLALAIGLVCGGVGQAAENTAPVARLPEVKVVETALTVPTEQAAPSTQRITALQIAETINLVDAEDAVKYLPSIFVRKRNYGDTQPVVASRVWGVGSSARSLVYADGVLLSALIANNNVIGAPRWGLVPPRAIERLDVTYGPFSAAYPGNSMGAVIEIVTREPERREASFAHSFAWQTFDQYGTARTFPTRQTSASLGSAAGRWSVWASGNFQESRSQPLSYIAAPAPVAGTSGGFQAYNKLGQPAIIVGAGGLLHTRMTNLGAKLSCAVTPTLHVAYGLSCWRNDGDSAVETYLHDATGAPTFGGVAGFAGSYYELEQQHVAETATLSVYPSATWNVAVVLTDYRMSRDWQRTPGAVAASGLAFSKTGRTATLNGTGWTTVDAKARWRSAPKDAAQVLMFGLHRDGYRLRNPTYNTADWRNGDPITGVATEGDGKTRTDAAWLQHQWTLSPSTMLMYGARYEAWRAYDGLNVNGSTTVRQPVVTAHGLSPKATFRWAPGRAWRFGASIGQAYRFATAAELFQLVSTGNTFTAPDPHLKPDNVQARELKAEYRFDGGKAQLAFFQDDIRDAIVAQFKPLVAGSPQLYSFASNVDRVRARGVEGVLERTNLFTRGLGFSGSVTYVDARTLALSGRASATAPAGAAEGKRLPNIPTWRAAGILTYRPGEAWAFSVGGRYSGMLYTTLDNTDVNPNTWQGFGAWFVADVRVRRRLGHWALSAGIDNILDREYFVFHPFPQRTYVFDASWSL